jgi:superfamily I DNA/RNA helicase
LEFDLVYLIGVDRIRPTAKTRAALTALVYVGITRARQRLVIPYLRESDFIRRMDDCVENNSKA